MKIVLIMASPRSSGTSEMVAEYMKGKLEKKGATAEIVPLYPSLSTISTLLLRVKESDTVVIVGPCYVDAYPAHTTLLLQKLSEAEGVLHGQSLYGFIQGGMPYVHTHESGLNQLSVFADETGLSYKGGFVMGGGAMLDGKSLENHINAKRMVPAIDAFIDRISRQEMVERRLYEEANGKVGGLMARIMAAFLSHMVRKRLKKEGIDYKKKSPYLS